MTIKCGIIGLPNIGKSTLFNAISKSNTARCENFPFCTIEPNESEVIVPDERLYKLAKIAESKTIIPTKIKLTDIAGLIKGSAQGEGLGNQFLNNIRQVSALIHVARCFEDKNITHIEEKIDPIRDIDLVETELILSDIEFLERNLDKRNKKKSLLDPEQQKLLSECLEHLNKGNPASTMILDVEAKRLLRNFGVLSAKPTIYVCNLNEEDLPKGNKHSDAVKSLAHSRQVECLLLSAKLEYELISMSDEEVFEYLETMGLKSCALDQLITTSYKLLNLITFFTAGPKETRAWTVKKGTKAPKAAGTIHTDFERGFIRAATISYSDYINMDGESGARNAGKQRDEGKEYILNDGDVIHFKFAV